MTILIVGCVLVYGLMTRPLVFPFYFPKAIRAVIELTPLVLLLLSFRNKFRSDILLLFPLSMFLMVNHIFNDASIQASFLIFIKLAFLLIMLDLLSGDISVRKLLRKLLVNFWWLVSLSVIISFVLYWVYEPAFSYAPLIVNDAGDGYGYYNNLLLGNVRRIYMVGIPVPKPTWYFVEPGPLSCFFALNFVGAKNFIADKSLSDRFKYCNLIAGLCTLSVTFYIFLALFYAFKMIENSSLITKMILITILVLFAYTWFTGGFEWLNVFFEEGSSQDNRLERFGIVSDIFSKYPEKTLLIGHGAELQGMGYDMGISSGWLVHFAERGFFFTIILASYLFYILRRNIAVFFVVAYYSFSFEFFAFPIFFIMLSMIVISDDLVPGCKSLVRPQSA